ncbi:hypothetical protein Q8F55_007248 [Vanrija albida]|uniref:Major facilitator superfamily (MFS) profile domain-containing protein n=1 Tax=Vanrija albida TaxID=181172 RepID=A0ABR3PZB9_9TREE
MSSLEAASSSKKALTLCLFQSLAGVIFGWGNSAGSGLFNMSAYKERFGTCHDGICALSTMRQSSFTGLLCLGALVGAVGAGSISERIGLRLTCIIFIVIHMIGSAIETSGINIQQVYCARVLLGLGIGATSGLVPVYQAEAAPPRWRGLITGSYQVCVTLGIWGVAMCSWGMSHYSGNVSWQLTVGLAMAYDLGLLIGFSLLPESPRFLAKKGRWDQCRKNLASLRSLPIDHPAMEHEMEVIRQKTAEDEARGNVRWAEVFSPQDRILYRVMIGVLVQVGQQLTGINFFFSYGQQFAATAGLDNPYIFQIILASVNIGLGFLGMYAVEAHGRRKVLLTGGIAMFIGQIVVGSVSKAHPHSKQAGDVLIAFTCLFIAAFASSWGPVAWVVCGETFPIRMAARCVTLGTGANWLMSLVIAFAAPQIQNRIGTGICFVWAGALAFDVLFCFFCIPETKGLSIEEIDALYLSRTPAFLSSKFVAQQQAVSSRIDEKASDQRRESQAAEPVSSSNNSVHTMIGEGAAPAKKEKEGRTEEV